MKRGIRESEEEREVEKIEMEKKWLLKYLKKGQQEVDHLVEQTTTNHKANEQQGEKPYGQNGDNKKQLDAANVRQKDGRVSFGNEETERVFADQVEEQADTIQAQ